MDFGINEELRLIGGGNWPPRQEFEGDNVLHVMCPVYLERGVNGIRGSTYIGTGVVGDGKTGVVGNGEIGVVGNTTDTNGNTPLAGVVGNGPSGVVGNSVGASPNSMTLNAGVVGNGDIGVAGNGESMGVYASGNIGVKGESETFVGVQGAGKQIGVQGVGETGLWGAGGPTGVYGLGGEVGIFGEIGGSGDQVDGIGVKGKGGGSTKGIGVEGTAGGIGVQGTGDTGVSGFGGIGVLGKANGSMRAIGHDSPAIGVKGSAIMGIGIYGEASFGFGYGVFCNGKFAATGTKSALVPHPDGSHRTLYCMESPESWFEDFGTGELVKGEATIHLDQDFVPLIQNGHYHVFLTPEGDSNGLYISHKSLTSFEVREQQNGSNTIRFSYRIVSKRKDVTSPRLEKVKLHEELLNAPKS
ncbi:hypothetical protein ACIG6B_28605 [Bacillus mobilis]|uniref:hypothetical protein n=1 Tax=Bacillati TaxID=1783272 RepID=UPI00362A6A39